MKPWSGESKAEPALSYKCPLTGHTRYPTTDEVFFVQNAGAMAAGTGLNKSNIIQKISLPAAQAFANGTNQTAEVEVTTVSPEPNVINSNGKSHSPRKLSSRC